MCPSSTTIAPTSRGIQGARLACRPDICYSSLSSGNSQRDWRITQPDGRGFADRRAPRPRHGRKSVSLYGLSSLSTSLGRQPKSYLEHSLAGLEYLGRGYSHPESRRTDDDSAGQRFYLARRARRACRGVRAGSIAVSKVEQSTLAGHRTLGSGRRRLPPQSLARLKKYPDRPVCPSNGAGTHRGQVRLQRCVRASSPAESKDTAKEGVLSGFPTQVNRHGASEKSVASVSAKHRKRPIKCTAHAGGEQKPRVRNRNSEQESLHASLEFTPTIDNDPPDTRSPCSGTLNSIVARRLCEKSSMSTWTRFTLRSSSAMIRSCAASP